MQDKIFRVLLILSAVVIPVIGGGIVYSLTADASGAFEHFGFWKFTFHSLLLPVSFPSSSSPCSMVMRSMP